MEYFQLASQEYVFLFAVPVLLVYVSFYFLKRRNEYLKFFFKALHLRENFDSFSLKKYWLKTSLITIVFILLIIALMNPQGNPVSVKTAQSGRDLFFVLDVSRSMLAEDLKPNRLEKAKELILSVLDKMSGDRAGLLIFAGNNALKAPLTVDYQFFRRVLEKIDPDSLSFGGTKIGDAIRTVISGLSDSEDAQYRDIILITDGEDHASQPLKAAEEAARHGIVIHTVGIGDPKGVKIAVQTRKGALEEEVISKLDEATLKRIAEITRGVYVPAQLKHVDLGDVYERYMLKGASRQTVDEEIQIYEKWYGVALLPAIFLLLLEMFISRTRKKLSLDFYCNQRKKIKRK